MNKLIMIAAVGKNRELGKDNDLIWHIKKDMKFFKEKTINHHILMGKNTFLSLPNLLKDRIHIVLTRSDYKFKEGVIVLKSIDEFENLRKKIDDDIYVIGGAKVYSEFIDEADMIYLTEIDSKCDDADSFFPKIKYEDYDREVLKEDSENGISFKHVLYKKKGL